MCFILGRQFAEAKGGYEGTVMISRTRVHDVTFSKNQLKKKSCRPPGSPSVASTCSRVLAPPTPAHHPKPLQPPPTPPASFPFPFPFFSFLENPVILAMYSLGSSLGLPACCCPFFPLSSLSLSPLPPLPPPPAVALFLSPGHVAAISFSPCSGCFQMSLSHIYNKNHLLRHT